MSYTCININLIFTCFYKLKDWEKVLSKRTRYRCCRQILLTPQNSFSLKPLKTDPHGIFGLTFCIGGFHSHIPKTYFNVQGYLQTLQFDLINEITLVFMGNWVSAADVCVHGLLEWNLSPKKTSSYQYSYIHFRLTEWVTREKQTLNPHRPNVRFCAWWPVVHLARLTSPFIILTLASHQPQGSCSLALE